MIRAAGEGEHRWFLGVLSTHKVSGADTDGRLAVIEMTFPKGASPPLHTHPQDETFYVLEGEVLAWEDANAPVRRGLAVRARRHDAFVSRRERDGEDADPEHDVGDRGLRA